MTYSAKIIADSISETGKRLTTFEICFPRIVLAEAKTHRMLRGFGGNIEELDLHNLGINDDENLSRNSASTRAIPLETQIARIENDTFIPERFPINGPGMQPKEWIEQDNPDYENHKRAWLSLRDVAIKDVRRVSRNFNWHKQLAGRLLENFMWHTAIVTATEWDNFFKLRTNEQAQYEIRRIADLMYEAYHSAPCPDGREGCEVLHRPNPKQLKQGEWHLPFISDEDDDLIFEWGGDNGDKAKQIYGGYIDNANDYRQFLILAKKRISVARCARVSYLTHDGVRDISKDLELFERLRTSGHWSPFEHVATPYFEPIAAIDYGDDDREEIEKINREDLPRRSIHNGMIWRNKRSGNFIGWKQYRKEFADENCTYFRKEK